MIQSFIAFMVVVGFIFPDTSFAWFSETGKEEIFLNQPVSSDVLISDTYVLLYNRAGQTRNLSILPDYKSQFYVVADRININIPFNVLSKDAIDPDESIDRLLAVNLRVRTILDEYAKLENRAELLLKDLSIPYLNRPILQKKNRFISSIQQQSVMVEKNKLKDDFANIVNNSSSHKVNVSENNQTSLSGFRFSRLKKKERLSRINSVNNQSPDPAPVPEFEKVQRVSKISFAKRSNDKLPWIFRFVLKVFQYCIDHKVEIIIFIVLSLFFIALIPRKGRL